MGVPAAAVVLLLESRARPGRLVLERLQLSAEEVLAQGGALERLSVHEDLPFPKLDDVPRQPDDPSDPFRPRVFRDPEQRELTALGRAVPVSEGIYDQAVPVSQRREHELA